MDNRELIAKMRARANWRDTDAIIDALLTAGADALERAEAELADLREVISQTASAIGNGARIDKSSSIEFIKGLPTEVRLHCTRLRADAYQADEECKAAQAELAKYRSAPVVGYLQGHAFYHKHQTRPVADEVQLIIRPEAP